MEASTANEPAASGTPTPSLGDAAAKRTRSSARPGSSRWACCGIATSTLWLAAFGASVGTWMEMIGVQWVMARPRSIRRDEPQADRRPHHDGLPGRGPTRPTLVLGWWAGSPRIASTAGRCSSSAGPADAGRRVAGGDQRVGDHVADSWQLSLVNGVVLAFNIPAWQVLTPRLVPHRELTAAIAQRDAVQPRPRGGPGGRGVLMGLYGPTVLFVVNTLSFLGVLVAAASTPDCPPRTTGPARGGADPRPPPMCSRQGPAVPDPAIAIFAAGHAAAADATILVSGSTGAGRGLQALLASMGLGAVAGTAKLVPRGTPSTTSSAVDRNRGVSLTACAAATSARRAAWPSSSAGSSGSGPSTPLSQPATPRPRMRGRPGVYRSRSGPCRWALLAGRIGSPSQTLRRRLRDADRAGACSPSRSRRRAWCLVRRRGGRAGPGLRARALPRAHRPRRPRTPKA